MIEIDPVRFAQLKADMGTLPAREQCMREAVAHAIARAQNMADLKHVLAEIIKQIRFTK